ncbi:MAG: D-alanyl-D-alanine carboxypeptidase/D-alanyl-D-alanine-endopeptidase [Bacteroidota bacterium]|nr:D-alanyl-D-alanine carboxypeptidase/D-alanyl-D-alanine-endopeptidase [Bacteroidota bacterium]
MNRKILLTVSSLFLFFSGFAQKSEALKHFISNNCFSSAGLSVAVKNVDNGNTIVSYNSQLNLTPASTQKLLTTATALEMFGPEFRFETRVYYSGKISSSGVLTGDIVVKGSGDPTLGAQYSSQGQSAFFDTILSALKRKGIHDVKGKIIGDERLYNTEIVPWKTPWEDMGNYYAAGVSALNYSDNSYKLTFKTGAAGSRPRIVGVEPTVEGLKFQNFLVAKDNDKDSAYLYGMPYCHERYIYGSVPANQSAFSIKGDVPDPALFAVQSLAMYLKSRGVKVSGEETTSRILEQQGSAIIPNGEILCTFKSDSLGEIIKVTNKKSYNFYAEALLRLIASRYSKDGSLPAGIAAEKAFWDKKGLNAGKILIYDGSGLAPSNRVNSGFLVDLLRYMITQSSNKESYVRSLAIAGEDGTLKSFLANTALKGKVKAKSGSFEGVLTYAGIVNKNGSEYIFCVMVNAFTCQTSVVKRAIEQFLMDL